MADIHLQASASFITITELYLCQIYVFILLLHQRQNASRNTVCIKMPKYSENPSDGF